MQYKDEERQIDDLAHKSQPQLSNINSTNFHDDDDANDGGVINVNKFNSPLVDVVSSNGQVSLETNDDASSWGQYITAREDFEGQIGTTQTGQTSQEDNLVIENDVNAGDDIGFTSKIMNGAKRFIFGSSSSIVSPDGAVERERDFSFQMLFGSLMSMNKYGEGDESPLQQSQPQPQPQQQQQQRYYRKSYRGKKYISPSPSYTETAYSMSNSPGFKLEPLNTRAPSYMTSPSSSRIYKLSTSRWFVLFAFALLSYTNAWIWITWSPFVPLSMEIWNVSDADVDALSSVFMYAYIPLALPSIYIVSVHGLKVGLYTGSVLNFAGAFFRFMGFSSYPMVYFGTLMSAIGQAFVLSIPPYLAGEWFGSGERATATSIGVLSNQLGAATGLGASLVVSNSEDALFTYVFVQAGVALVSLILVLLWVKRSRPKYPPSLAKITTFNIDETSPMTIYFNSTPEFNEKAISKLVSKQLASSKPPSFGQSLELYFSKPSNVLFGLIYGIVVGVFYALCTFLSQYVSYSPEECGLLGVLFVFVGTIGPVIATHLLDSTGRHRRVALGTVIGCFICMSYFTIAIWLLPSNRIHVYSSLLSTSILLTALISNGFEYGTAIAYPADENVVAGLLNCFAQVFGWIFVRVGGSLNSVDGYLFNTILTSSILFSIVLFVVTVKDDSNRPSD